MLSFPYSSQSHSLGFIPCILCFLSLLPSLVDSQSTNPEANTNEYQTIIPDCSSDTVVTYNQSLQIGSIFIILFSSLFGTGFPLLSKEFPRISFSPYWISIGKSSGIGIILSCSLIHMLQPASVALTNPCLANEFTEDYPSYAFLFALIGILFMHFITFLVEDFILNHSNKINSKNILLNNSINNNSINNENNNIEIITADNNNINKDNKLINTNNNNNNNNDKSTAAGGDSIAAQSAIKNGLKLLNEKPINNNNNNNQCTDHCIINNKSLDSVVIISSTEYSPSTIHIENNEIQSNQFSDSPSSPKLLNSPSATNNNDQLSHRHSHDHQIQILKPFDHHHNKNHILSHSHNNDSPHHHDQHGHSHFITLEPGIEKTISAYLLEFGMTSHSIFIGLQLGLSSETELKKLIIALVFHQFFEGIALGSRLFDADSLTSFHRWSLAAVFSISAPIGQAIGIGLTSSLDVESRKYLLVSGTFDGFCAGILLFIGLSMLIEDFKNDLKRFGGNHNNNNNNMIMNNNNSNICLDNHNHNNNEIYQKNNQNNINTNEGKWKKFGLFCSLWIGGGVMAFIGRYL